MLGERGGPDPRPRVKEIPERDIPDNGPQQEAFKAMLRREREARAYLIGDERSGCGKTMLLRRLQWLCEAGRSGVPSVAAALVDLEELAEPGAFALVKAIANQLGPACLPGVQRLRDALDDRNPAPFLENPLAGQVNAAGATIQDQAQVAGTITNVNLTVHGDATVYTPQPAPPRWEERLQVRAERTIVAAFFDDLRALSDDRPVVLFVDSVDGKARDRALVDWVKRRLLADVFLDPAQRPAHAILCLAGCDLPDYSDSAAYAPLVETARLLSAWDARHTEAFLRLMLDHAAISQQLVGLAHELITERRSPLQEVYQRIKPIHDLYYGGTNAATGRASGD